MLRPRLANSLAYSFPIPSVDPVITTEKKNVYDVIILHIIQKTKAFCVL
jgi:hypothetical protein